VPSLLDYAVITDPASLVASGPDGPSVGTVYLIVSNSHAADVRCTSIEVMVPAELTSAPESISARIEPDFTVSWEDPRFAWDSADGVFRVTSPTTTTGAFTVPEGGCMVLVLENVRIDATAGLVLLQLSETAGGGEGSVGEQIRTVKLGLLAKSPNPKKPSSDLPRNFRPEKSVVDAGTEVVLLWDGPNDLVYTIRHPYGKDETVPQGTYRWSPAPDTAPQRGTTYTLVATSRSGPEPPYFLTTTVHLRNPTFETLTATVGTRTPLIQGTESHGYLTFSSDGLSVLKSTGAFGTVVTGTVAVNDVFTDRARVNGLLTVMGAMKVINERGKMLLETHVGDDGISFPENCSFGSSVEIVHEMSVQLRKGWGYTLQVSDRSVSIHDYLNVTKSVFVESDREWSKDRGGQGRRV
jgi:hypothetical protein